MFVISLQFYLSFKSGSGLGGLAESKECDLRECKAQSQK